MKKIKDRIYVGKSVGKINYTQTAANFIIK